MLAERQKSIFNEWLDEYKGLIFKIVHAYSTDLQDQDDLFQDILLQLWISIPGFGGKAEVSTWIYRVAKYGTGLETVGEETPARSQITFRD